MLPSGETSTAVTAAHGMPPGGLAQSRTVRYGLGRSLMGCGTAGCGAVWAKAVAAPIAIKRGKVIRAMFVEHDTPVFTEIQ